MSRCRVSVVGAIPGPLHAQFTPDDLASRSCAIASPGISARLPLRVRWGTRPIACSPSRVARTTLAFIPLVFAAGCVGNIQRSARVPHPDVPLTSGQPLAGPVEGSLGLGNLTDVVAPQVGNPTQAVEVPETQMRDELRVRLGQRGSGALVYERGFASTSHMPDPTQAPVGDGDVSGYGATLGYSFATSHPGLSIGTTLEMITWSVPYVEYETCTNCIGDVTVIDHGRTLVGTLGLGVQPSYKSGAITVFGGAFARNHPTTTRKEYNTDITFSDNGDVHGGPLNLLLDAGLEYAFSPNVSGLVVVHQDVVADPVQYGPGIGVAIAAHTR